MAALFQVNRDGSHTKILIEKDEFIIGRGTDADVVFRDPLMSRHHCVVKIKDGRYFVRDLGSKNGTFVNGMKVHSIELKFDDTLHIGAVSFVFQPDVGKGTETLIQEMEAEVKKGKGYHTLMGELVKEVDDKSPKK